MRPRNLSSPPCGWHPLKRVNNFFSEQAKYRGRLAPSPTGLLHIGHARTFWIATQRAAERRGTLILRNEDLDRQRCRAEFVDAMIEDLRWLGISWQEGPDCAGPFAPYTQSERREFYLEALKRLREIGAIYPCSCSRKDVSLAAGAPNDDDDEPIYSGKCRPKRSGRRRLALRLRSGLAGRTRRPSLHDLCTPRGLCNTRSLVDLTGDFAFLMVRKSVLTTCIWGHNRSSLAAISATSSFGGAMMFRPTNWRSWSTIPPWALRKLCVEQTY